MIVEKDIKQQRADIMKNGRQNSADEIYMEEANEQANAPIQ